MSKEKKGAAKKEALRQEKKKWKKEMRESKEAARQQRNAGTFKRNADERPSGRTRKAASEQQRPFTKDSQGAGSRKPVLKKADPATKGKSSGTTESTMPLNKFIAHSGICARRDAAELVKNGRVKVNGEKIIEPGFKVSQMDDVKVDGKKIHLSKNVVYILLNKPKDYITTTEDPEQRKTVLDLIKRATTERVYPVGRLDRNTSGVLLLTNDGDLSQKLTHPSNEVRKLYAVTLDKPLTRAHFDQILKGVQLEDGLARVDSLAFTDAKDPKQLGVEIHSGKNRIVRRIFEHLGYDVKGLDRVMFAGLTKKNVERGKWRFLTEREVRDLKFFNKGRK